MKTLMNMMLAMLLLTANVTIAQAINYPTYNNTVHVIEYDPNALAPGYQAGDEVFQTSNLTPLVDEEGMAVEPYSAPSNGPRRAGDTRPGGGQQAGTGNGSGDNMIPIGSVLILLLLALMHVAYIAYSTSARKQK